MSGLIAPISEPERQRAKPPLAGVQARTMCKSSVNRPEIDRLFQPDAFAIVRRHVSTSSKIWARVQ